MIEHILWLIACIITGTLGVWRARSFAIQKNWLDQPNERSFHSRPTPRIGGWGVLLPVILSVVVLTVFLDKPLPTSSWVILIPAFAVALLSFFDDRFDLPRPFRFGVHVLCAICVLWLLRDAWIGRSMPLFDNALPVWICGFLLVIWIAGLTNAYNFMDGIDGISAIQGIVAMGGWIFVSVSSDSTISANHPMVFLLIAISGGCIGFLIFNWSPASIFIGDIGSTFLGFFLAALPLAFAHMGMPLAKALEAAVLFTWPFIIDTGITFTKRLIRREPVFDAHRSHVYQLFAATFSTRDSGHCWTSILFGSLSILGIGLYRMDTPFPVKLAVIGGVWVLVVAWTHLRARISSTTRKDHVPSYPPVSDHKAFDIFLSPPEISELEYQYVSEAFDSGYIAPVGPQVNAFEGRLAQYLGLQEMHVVSSGTAAIHLGLRALGVGPGDCVLCPDMTFIASCNPIRYLGAEPVLVDVSQDNWAIDPQLLKKAIHSLKTEGRTVRAMVIVHALGIPAPMDEIMAIASEENILVLEDCAGAFGSKIGDSFVGNFGDASAFSFNGNKILTTSGGGALYIRDEDQRESARSWANQGKKLGVIGYEHESLGYNYKLSNISAAIGLAQLETVDLRLDKKRKLYDRYLELLNDTKGITQMPIPGYGTCNYWLSNIGFNSWASSTEILEALRKARIEALPLWKPMHLQSLNKDLRFFGNDTSALIHRRFLSLPSGSQLSDSQIIRITDVIRKHLPVA